MNLEKLREVKATLEKMHASSVAQLVDMEYGNYRFTLTYMDGGTSHVDEFWLDTDGEIVVGESSSVNVWDKPVPECDWGYRRY